MKDYASYLLRSTGQGGSPPVALKPIFDRFSLSLSEVDMKSGGTEIEGMNVAEIGVILYDASDRQTRQRFTQAHELVESLLSALKGNRYRNSVKKYIEQNERKERLCNWGASCILMPLGLFNEHVQETELGIEAAEQIGEAFQTSRLATLWHMVYCYPRSVGLVVWKYTHKPADEKSMADSSQLSFLDEGYRHAPQKELRAQWNVFGSPAEEYQVPRNKSVSRDSLIFQAYDEGALCEGREQVSLVNLEGEFQVEAAPFVVGNDTYVVSLFHWPDSLLNAEQAEAFD
ncbi:ImmA/IrrE family metallo-endopeptidase [Salinibacter altiplanensis]|uniref:ImmA/IrrE family metallo-endopeptidase n=1 Tax=Salinibacter altiplanensis TaxID=1803181 RepID=UPI00131A2E52|nr:ImmA/IrrE family metallo-endopeptidase [Salinibacter altiplanensis]